MHEKRLEDALGVVERPVSQRELLHLSLGRDAAAPPASSPPRAASFDCPRVHELREEIDERVHERRAEILPEEDGRVADLRAQVLERELGAVADAKVGEFLAGGERDGLALAGLQRQREALPRGVELGLCLCELVLEVVDGCLFFFWGGEKETKGRGKGMRRRRKREFFVVVIVVEAEEIDR